MNEKKNEEKLLALISTNKRKLRQWTINMN